MTDHATNTSDTCCAHCGLPVPLPRRVPASQPSEVASRHFCCLGCRMAFGLASAGHDGDEHVRPNTLLLRVGLGVFLTMNLMVFNWFFYSKHVYESAGSATGDGSTLVTSLFAYLLMLLCTLIVALLGLPIAAHVTAERRVRIDVSALILIGVLAAFGISVVNTLRGEGPLYYDTASMILLLVTLGAYLDSRAKRKAVEATNPLTAALPARASAQRGGEWVDVETATLTVGELVRVGAGDALPVDGVVVDGHSDVNESTLTGESRPRGVEAGDHVLAGSLCVDGSFVVLVERVGGDLAIARMRQLLEEARLRQPRIQRIADRVAACFVPGVVLLAIAVAAWHGIHHGADRGLLAALSVLLISCPCALGLAAPLATWRAMNHAAKRGILFDCGATLERAARVDHVLFDKTGTLTRAALAVDDVRTAPGLTPDDALALAASLAVTSRHPVGAALLDEARKRRVTLRPVVNAHTLPGRGVEGVIDGEPYRLGNERLIAGKANVLANQGGAGGAASAADDETTRVLLLRGSDVIATFALHESLRPESMAAVARLRKDGMDVQVLTGDRAGPARRLSEQLGVRVHHNLLPADKVRHVQSARQSAHRARGVVAFVGDGLNDAPALASADVGIAVHGATDLARQAGHVVLMSDRIENVPEVLAIARDAMRRIRLNLMWAFGYNGVGLTLAAMGLLNPIIAALAMVASSLFVVATSMSESGGERRGATSAAPRETDGVTAQTAQVAPIAEGVAA